MTDAVILVHQPAWGDPWTHPEYFAGITAKRIVAYAIDFVVVGMLVAMAWTFLIILGVVTLGLAWGLLWLPGLLVPLAYHSLQIAAPRSATLGMRIMGIRVLSLTPAPFPAPVAVTAVGEADSGRPTLIQAIIQTAAFYASVVTTGSLILLVALFNSRRRTLHDWLAATVVVNDIGAAAGG